MSLFSTQLKKLIDKLRPVDYFAAYECIVRAVNSDGTLDLEPLDERLKPGPQFVEIMPPAGYEKITPMVDSHCMMSFKNGSPDRPYVEFFSLDSQFQEIAIRATIIKFNGGDQAIARKGDSVGTLTALDSLNKAVTFTYTPLDGPPVTSATVELHVSEGNETVNS